MNTVERQELVEIFAANLRTRRRELGVTQVQLAEKSGLTQAYISVLERGTAIPQMDVLAPLATALNTTPQALVTPGNFLAHSA
jgi:transcriptional regulator with XRE-family HTH domain